MTLTQMRYFYEVSRWQNISKAAESLHVAQPTVSIAIQALERETGLNLLMRESNRVFITSDGNVLLGKIRPILEQIDRLDAEVQDMGHRHNHIRMALPVQLGTTFLPILLGRFRKQYPDIDLEIVEMGGVTALHMVEEGRLDLAFTNFRANASDRLEYHKLFDCECFFCTWKDHPLAQKKSVSIQDLAGEPLALLDHHFAIYRLVHDAFDRAGVEPQVLHYTPYIHTAKNLVRHRLASTFLIRQAILPEEPIVLLPLETPFYIDSGIVMKKGRQLYEKERVLMQYLRKIVE